MPGKPGAVTERVITEIDRLLAGGLAPHDIAVVSLRGRTAASAVLGRPQLGPHAVVEADHPAFASSIVVDTFLRFKGLERPAVIITDLGGVAEKKRDLRSHIALTRAFDLVRIVAEDAVVQGDPILSSLANL
jgi:superfamily I DNA and RNA helicase